MENAKNKKQTESERAEAERVEAEAELEDRHGSYNYLFGNFIIGFTYFYHTWPHAV